VLDPRGQLLRAAVGFAGCSMTAPFTPSARGSTRGPGSDTSVDMHRQGYDVQLTQYDDRAWRATFYTTGMEHSPTSATGTGWERTRGGQSRQRRGERLARSTRDVPVCIAILIEALKEAARHDASLVNEYPAEDPVPLSIAESNNAIVKWVRLCWERLNADEERENDREPDQPHEHLGGGWLAGV
jgi:hypothetical protein